MVVEVILNEGELKRLLNSSELVDVLNQVSTSINAAARTYTGVFTGDLYDSMQVVVETTNEGAQATLGSGAMDHEPVGQAALNWYGHTDPDGLGVRPDYPIWTPDHDVKPHPSRPYEQALRELDIEATVAPEWKKWAEDGGES